MGSPFLASPLRRGTGSVVNELSRNIIERVWRTEIKRTEQELAEDMWFCECMSVPVYHWTGQARDGSPLTVTWVAAVGTGTLCSAYEITGGA